MFHPGTFQSFQNCRGSVTAGSRQWPRLKDPRISCIENTKLKRRRREREGKGIKEGKYKLKPLKRWLAR
jgi:hypothetical protein